MGVRLWSFMHICAAWFAGTLDAGSAPYISELLTHTLGAADHFIDDCGEGDRDVFELDWPLGGAQVRTLQRLGWPSLPTPSDALGTDESHP